MLMKPITALLLISMAAVGTACSDPVAKASDTVPVETASAEPEIQGTLNLNIGQAPASGGGLNLGPTSTSNSGGLIVAPGSTGASFEDVGDLGIDIEVTPDSVLDQKPASDEDDIVRLPEKK
jgi:hypothetical protein